MNVFQETATHSFTTKVYFVQKWWYPYSANEIMLYSTVQQNNDMVCEKNML